MLKALRRQLRDAKRRRGPQEAPSPFEEPARPPPEMPARDPISAARLEAIAPAHPALHAALDRLDPWQLRAVLADEDAVLVRAQVGSGKTTVLVHKVLWLHLVEEVPLDRIAVLTFTHKAAGEISARIAALSPGGPPPASATRLHGTFHSVARALLHHSLPIEELGYTMGFHLLDALEREATWARLIAEHELSIKYARKLNKRFAALDEGRPLYGNMKAPDDIERLVELYRKEKLRLGAMDFDDLLIGAQVLLARHPLDPPLAWVVVDELQDCDHDQLDLIARLRGEGTQLFAVGDPNQVIYGWRGSSLEIFERLAKRHGAVIYTLPVNYRCSGTIVEGARAFLRASGPVAREQRADLDALTPTRPRGAPITVVRHYDPLSEARYLAAKINTLERQGVPLERVAILTRTRRQLGPLEAALRDSGLKVVEGNGRSTRSLPAVRWLGRLLRAGLFAGDDESARVALCHPDYGVLPDKALAPRALREARERSGASGLEAIAAFLRERPRRRRGDLPLALDVLDRLKGLRSWLVESQNDGHLQASTLLDWLHVSTLLRPTTSQYARDLQELQGWLQGLLQEARERPERVDEALADLVAGAAVSDRRGQRGDHPGAASLLTMHASKGLEFDVVFVSGANDGMLPVGGALTNPEQLAEERRLFFVALTRARDRVEISWHVQPDHARIRPEPSPFLRLLPVTLVRWLDAPEEAMATIDGEVLDTGESSASETSRGSGGAEAGADDSGNTDAPDKLDNSGDLDEPDDWQIGVPVHHRRYGAGAISRLDRDAIFARFGDHGEKRFLRAMCPLRRDV